MSEKALTFPNRVVLTDGLNKFVLGGLGTKTNKCCRPPPSPAKWLWWHISWIEEFFISLKFSLFFLETDQPSIS